VSVFSRARLSGRSSFSVTTLFPYLFLPQKMIVACYFPRRQSGDEVFAHSAPPTSVFAFLSGFSAPPLSFPVCPPAISEEVFQPSTIDRDKSALAGAGVSPPRLRALTLSQRAWDEASGGSSYGRRPEEDLISRLPPESP